MEPDRPQYIGNGRKKKLNMADMSGGAFLSDMLGTLGGITPKISGLVGKVPTYGPVATIGNSALGSFSRVGEDIAKMLGLGNMDTTLAGFGNMDLTGKTKGYGKKKGGSYIVPMSAYGFGKKQKGGMKMLPKNHPLYQHGRPKQRNEDGMAYIQPYGLEAEPPYELNGGSFLGDLAGDIGKDLFNSIKMPKILPSFHDTFNFVHKNQDTLKNVLKPENVANAIKSFGKGRKLKGCGKINGKYVSSEFEDNYENQLMRNLNMDKMRKIQAEQQMEAQIQHNMNMEQASALQQLQYYDMLNKLHQKQ